MHAPPFAKARGGPALQSLDQVHCRILGLQVTFHAILPVGRGRVHPMDLILMAAHEGDDIIEPCARSLTHQF